ncbi:nucleosidase [Rhodococcus tibetensis]|uniref:Nucleosidase n=1 Tax=Rhodococcus tibetensis TaxID=2965064 RepID=A0ABT1QAB7_9NOCA|nr:nucleosidase [Rhodococcus sp. FXJ9.536]MCQ4119211.1 nucleosidase [Rhodococcus sp. FXJ9.536]
MSRSDILVVSATKAEAVHVPPEFDVLITGIGKVSAAVAVANALADYPSSQKPLVVNIGTAGALHEHHSGLFVPSIVLNHDISGNAIRALGHEVADRLDIPEGDGSVLATGDVFVSDAAVRDVLAGRADLVDMEGFAVAYACARAGVRCRLVKHVSDTADDSALDWPARIDASARGLAQWLQAL